MSDQQEVEEGTDVYCRLPRLQVDDWEGLAPEVGKCLKSGEVARSLACLFAHSIAGPVTVGICSS